MSTEFRSGQGSIVPTLFVGLGGTGSRIVDRIAARARRLPNWDSQLDPLTTFVTIDTNELDQHKLSHVPPGNRINIAAFDKSRVIEGYRRSKDPQALQWLAEYYQPRPGIKPGAGQIRVESRLGFFYCSSTIRERVKQLVQESLRPNITWRQASPPKYNVYLFCTLAGGTGSGSFLSMAYLVSDIIRRQHWQPRVIGNLLLSTLMLDKVGIELHGDIHANTYAALKELEHLTKLDYKQVKDEGRKFELFAYARDENAAEVPRVDTRPFFLSFIFDRPAHLSLPDVEAAVGDVSYLQIFTPIVDNLAGELDNYEKRLEKLTTFPGELKNVGLGYTKNCGAVGAAALVLPGRDLLGYAKLRFAAQAIRSQITFGVNRDDANDDRARALARLAVDYNDPAFLASGDEGREQRINQAFVDCVREMARQDERRGLTQGYWFELVESVDSGRITGVDDKGEPLRAESIVKTIERKLEERRKDLVNKVSIKDRAFVFHKEGLNQYIELVSRLLEDIRLARVVVDEGSKGLKASAAEGEVIADLELDPMAERYVVLRLLELVAGKWIPEAEAQRDKAKLKDVSNAKVKERLEKELYETLQQAASTRKLFGGDKAFLDAREEAQEYYRGIASAARRMFEADIQLAQVRALHEYLRRRARQYARLSVKMEGLVQSLEIEAERRRRGEGDQAAGLALRVEVFETLDEPRTRIWDRVFRELFVERGQFLTTFDRNVLAKAIARELKPVVQKDGTVAEKTVEQIEKDLRAAFLDLGEQRLRAAIFGDESSPGLDLARGLEIEARLVLQPTLKNGEVPSPEMIAAYQEKKFRALAQLGGVLARVDTAEARAVDDGVVVNRTRQLIVGRGDHDGGKAAEEFVRRLEIVLSEGGRQVKTDRWFDRQMAIVHDVELAIPLYYVKPVIHEIEDAYVAAASDERRSYDLHTDCNWEKSLPNLNPRRSEVVVGWSLRMLADGLLCKVVSRPADGGWLCDLGDGQKPVDLGSSLSRALYRLGEIHRHEDINAQMERRIAAARAQMTPEAVRERCAELVQRIGQIILDMGRRELHGVMSREDVLDRPIYRVLLPEIERAGIAPAASGTASRGIDL